MEKHFMGVTVRAIPRLDNAEADLLARAASTKADLPPGAIFEVISTPSTKDLPTVHLIAQDD